MSESACLTMSDLHWNGSNITAPLQKLMPPMNRKNLSIVSNNNMKIILIPHLSFHKNIKYMLNKSSEYLFITHKRWILLISQHWTRLQNLNPRLLKIPYPIAPNYLNISVCIHNHKLNINPVTWNYGHMVIQPILYQPKHVVVLQANYFYLIHH